MRICFFESASDDKAGYLEQRRSRASGKALKGRGHRVDALCFQVKWRIVSIILSLLFCVAFFFVHFDGSDVIKVLPPAWRALRNLCRRQVQYNSFRLSTFQNPSNVSFLVSILWLLCILHCNVVRVIKIRWVNNRGYGSCDTSRKVDANDYEDFSLAKFFFFFFNIKFKAMPELLRANLLTGHSRGHPLVRKIFTASECRRDVLFEIQSTKVTSCSWNNCRDVKKTCYFKLDC